MNGPIITVEKAFELYKSGRIRGWDLVDVVQGHGWDGFSVDGEGKLLLHSKVKLRLREVKPKNHLRLVK